LREALTNLVQLTEPTQSLMSNQLDNGLSLRQYEVFVAILRIIKIIDNA